RERVRPGPYAKVGFADYFVLEMPWAGNPGSVPLTAPSEAVLGDLLARAASHGLTFHFSAIAGVSRAVAVYTDAKREDRRNAQWFASGAIRPPSFAGSADDAVATAYVTPSRYARNLRRHREAKVRAFAKRFLALRAAHPDTLISASGDAEAELDSEGEDPGLPYDEQPIADYSPFAVLEFRDWLLHAGLYADGGPFAGEGYEKRGEDAFDQGANALTSANLAKFNAEFGTPFATWNLEYFNWSLSDPIDGDPHALGPARTSAPGWSGSPTAGPDFIAGGFDAPRHRTQYDPRLWDIWLEFRSHMLASYARDFATWMTTTPGADGATLEPERWYSHQIPGDYLNGTRPGAPNPERRLLTSASAFWTSIVGDDVGSPGVTVLDRLEAGAFGRPTYRRTSQYLFDAIAGLEFPNWGMPEYSPSWHIDVAPEPLSAVILVQYLRAAAAGVHMLAFTPWPHFVSTANGRALGDFVDRVKYRPRGSSATSWLPPQVHGVSGSATERSGSLAWSGDVFPGVADFAWSEWPSFFRFEVWRGSHAGFGTSDGRLVKLSTTPGATSIALDPSRKFYKVLAASREGRRGALSDAWVLDPAGSGPANPPGGPTPTPGPVATPTPGPGGGGGPRMRGIPSCKLADTRYGGDPALAPFERR